MDGRALANVLVEVLSKMKVVFSLGVDNQAAISLASDPTYSRKTHHIELRFHYVREQVARKAVRVRKVDGDINPANLLTKPLGYPRPVKMKRLIKMHPATGSTPREQLRQLYHEKQKQTRAKRRTSFRMKRRSVCSECVLGGGRVKLRHCVVTATSE